MKVCNVCKQEKPDSEFYRRAKSPDGLAYGCKKCKKAKALKWYRDNREHVLDRMADYYDDNAEEIKARTNAHYHENYEEIAEQRRQKYWADPEAARERGRQDYRRNAEAYKARAKKWREENHERYLDGVRNWQERNPERHKENAKRIAQRRRARMDGLPDDFTADEWTEILEVYGYRCAYCGDVDSKLQQDHIVPVCQGGGYTADNIVPACAACNARKGGRTPEQSGMELIACEALA